VLISLVLPVANKVRARAQQVVCASQLRQIGIALTAYVQDTGYYPGSFVQGPDVYYSVWPTRLRRYLNGNRAVFHCPSRDERSVWTDRVPSAAEPPAPDNYQGYGYEPGEALLNARSTSFSYGYNTGSNGNRGYLGLGRWSEGETITDQAPFVVKASRVKVQSEMIAVGDSEPDGPFPLGIDTSSWNQEEYDAHGLGHIYGSWGPVARVHFKGANLLFCDGHIQWYLRSDVCVLDALLIRASDEQINQIARLWVSDHEPVPVTSPFTSQ
jgi:prepilin-type processing-associated H-X9-DG protein